MTDFARKFPASSDEGELIAIQHLAEKAPIPALVE
jgi:hypothetical protein